jgi:hypothetical protein
MVLSPALAWLSATQLGGYTTFIAMANPLVLA